MTIEFFFEPALVLQSLFPLALQRRGHESIGRIYFPIAPLRQLRVVTGTLKVLLPMLVQPLALASKVGARFQTQLQRRRLQRAEYLARYQLIDDIAGDAEARLLRPSPIPLAGSPPPSTTPHKTTTVVTSLSCTSETMTRPAVRPFVIHVPEEDLVDLRRRAAATRWPDRETVDDRSKARRSRRSRSS